MAKNKYTDLGNDNEWQEKYYASLEELESKERLWQESESILRTLITRLSLAADKTHPGLNQQLEILREAIRDNISALKLKKAVDEISATISELETIRQTSNQSSTAAVKPFVDLVEKLGPAANISGKLKKIQKKLLTLQDVADITPLSDELAKLLLAGLTVAEKRKSKGFFAGLMAKEAGVVQASAVIQQTPQRTDEIDHDVALQEAILALKNLLERMILPEDLQVEANLIKRILLEQSDEQSFMNALDKTLAMVAEILSRIKKEKNDIEEFLKQLTLRLHELDSDLIQSVKFRELSNQSGKDISQTMDVDINNIENSIKSIVDLEELKTSIQSRIIVMRNHFDDYISQESQRNQQSIGLIEELQNKLQKMEKESEQLKQQLETERQQTLRDALTGIPNRLAYDERIEIELARFKRIKEAFALMVWDVDYFKKINDTYGHASGDRVLKVIANLLSKQIRESDFIGRYGGEEFVIILPNTDLDGARQLAEKLRATVEQAEFHFRETPVKITASCGIALVNEHDSVESVFGRADTALYAAKAAGRNNYQVG